MCGIAGIYNLNNQKVDADLINQMIGSLKHRGPDDSGFYVNNNVALGHARLSIIDLSPLGHQPMTNEDQNLQIVFNGEIYNFEELRKDLEQKGHNFKSKTDTEVILHSYEEWGKGCVSKFNGMFAFAILDEKQHSIFLARDRLGEKPLYYYYDNNKFIFASEIKAILQDKTITRQIDSQGMANFFAFGNSIAPDTIYQGIKKLMPGCCLLFKNGKIDVQSYWQLPCLVNNKDQGIEFYKIKILELLEKSVAERLVSDVPLGVFLSGGIDSSAIVALMSKIGVKQIKTFSVGFDFLGKEFNELEDAKFVAQHFKTDHNEIILKEPDLIDTLKKLVYHFDEPFGDAANFPIFLMSQFAKKYVGVVLTGDGSDEIFGGYRRYVIEKNYNILKYLKLLDGLVNNLPGLRRTKKLIESISVNDNLSRYSNWLRFFTDDMNGQLFKNQSFNNVDALKVYKKCFKNCSNSNGPDCMMYLDQKILLPDRYLEKVDKASMAVGLETRPPFLDHNLVEFANSIPLKYKIKGFNTKYILKESLRGILPENVLRKSKHGFAVPINAWFRGKLKDYFFEVVFDNKTKQRGYFNYDYIEKLYNDYQNKNQPFDSQLWLILNFELWHRQYLDK